MAINITGIIDAVTSHASASGLFMDVQGHEPKSAPRNGCVTFATWVDSVKPVQSSGLSVTSACVVLNVRLYSSFIQTNPDTIDPELVNALDVLMDAYAGDFTLGGLIRSVDIRGSEGEPLIARAGYLSQDGKIYRVFTVTLPLVVNDVWTEAP